MIPYYPEIKKEIIDCILPADEYNPEREAKSFRCLTAVRLKHNGIWYRHLLTSKITFQKTENMPDDHELLLKTMEQLYEHVYGCVIIPQYLSNTVEYFNLKEEEIDGEKVVQMDASQIEESDRVKSEIPRFAAIKNW